MSIIYLQRSKNKLLIHNKSTWGEYAAPKQQKQLQRCPTLNNSAGTKPSNGTSSPGQQPGSGAATPKRKESVTWSPFGALGKAVSSGVNIVGDATKAVGTGVVQGTKVGADLSMNYWEADLLC